MEKTGTLKIIIVLMICIALAGMIGTACAVNGMRTGFPAGVQPLTAGGTGAGSAGGGFNIPAAGGPQIGGQATAPGTPYATGGPSRCVGNLCTADWVGTGGPQIGSGTGAGGTLITPAGTAGTGPGTGLNLPAGTGVGGRDYSEWARRCTGVAGPGNDPMCYSGSPGSPYSTGGPQTGGVQGAGGTPTNLIATGGQQIGSGQGAGGTPGTLLYQLRPGDTRIGGVQG